MLKTEAEYKAKYISILRDPGDINLMPEIIKELCAKYAPQIVPPSTFIICNDYTEFQEKTNGNSDHPMNIANFISAIYSSYFSPSLISQTATSAGASVSVTMVSSGAPSWPQRDRYRLLDMELSFDEPTRISNLIANDNFKAVKTPDWLSGLAFDEMRTDGFNAAPIQFHGALCTLAQNCFAFWQKGEDFVMCAKPSLSLDFRYRLHHDTRKAVTFPSGDGFYALRGVRVDEKYMTSRPSGKNLMKERNAEVRMVLLEKYGSKLLDDVPHKIVSKKGDGTPFGFESPHTRLLEMDWDGYQKIRMLHLKWADKNGERHETLIHVPATAWEFQRLGHEPPTNIDDCEEMRRWVMRLNPEDTLIAET